jgi:GTPase Era involved in 16S rRNA processing
MGTDRPEEGPLTDFDTARARLLELLGKLAEAARTRGLDSVAEQAEAARDRLLRGRLEVLFCGEFKRGKSTLVNGVLGEPGLLPTDVVPTTNVVVTVEHGDPEEITVFAENGDAAGVRIDRDDLEHWVTESGNPGNAARAALIRIRTPNRRLESGLVMVDTPGVGGELRAHTQATLAHLPNAAAVVFVTDVTRPLTAREIDFLQLVARSTRTAEDEDGLILVFTKADDPSDPRDPDAFVDAERRKAADAMGRAPERVPTVAVSARAQVHYLRTGDEDAAEAANFAELEAMLWAALGRRRVRVLLGDALHAVELYACELIAPLEASIDARRAASRVELDRMSEEVRARYDEYAGLPENAVPRTGPQPEPELRKALTATLDERLDEMWDEIRNRCLFDRRYLEAPQTLKPRIESQRALILGELGQVATRRAAELLQELAVAAGLAPKRAAFRELPPPRVPEIVIHGGLRDTPVDRGMAKLRSTVFAAGVGGTVGTWTAIGAALALTGVVGLVPYLAGGVLGGLAGGTYGYRLARDSAAQKDRAAVRASLERELKPVQRDQRKQAVAFVDQLSRTYAQAITTELTGRLRARRDVLRDEANRLEQIRRSTEDDAGAAVQRLEADLRPLVALRDEGRVLAHDLTEPS